MRIIKEISESGIAYVYMCDMAKVNEEVVSLQLKSRKKEYGMLF